MQIRVGAARRSPGFVVSAFTRITRKVGSHGGVESMLGTHHWQFLKDDARAWCEGRPWQVRALLLVALAYMGLRHIFADDPGDIFMALTLAIHEAGHVIFRVFGNEPLMVAGGSITQLLGPIALGVSFLKQRDYFAIGVAGCWLSYSMYGMANYMADARALVLPLVSLGGGDDVIHDWNYLFDLWGVLAADTMIARAVRIVAFFVLVASLALSTWCCWRMARTRGAVVDAPFTGGLGPMV